MQHLISQHDLGAQVSAMQRNSATYCDEPEDKEAFANFVENYDADARRVQAEKIISTTPFMSELHSRLVPLVISDETFWRRYFYRCGLLTAFPSLERMDCCTLYAQRD
jgi:hypothetical protein